MYFRYAACMFFLVFYFINKCESVIITWIRAGHSLESEIKKKTIEIVPQPNSSQSA